MITDLTTGKPSKVLLNFTLPLLGSVVFQQLYNISDSIIAGRFAGEEALAAIGVSYPITMIFMAVAMGCNIGGSVVISQLFGSKHTTDMKTAVNTSFVMSAAVSIFLLLFGVAFCDPMLSLLNTPENIFSDGALYLNIYTFGLPFLFFYNISSGVYTALGDAKTPMYLLIGSSVGNIGLDLLFVAVFEWGVAGAAWATFIAQGIAAVISVILLFVRLSKLEYTERPKLFDRRIFRRIITVTVPSVLQQSFVSVGNLLIQGLINGYGSSVIAGYSAAIKLNTFAVTSFSAVGNGVSSYTAQNVGAGNMGRVKQGCIAGLKICITAAIPFIIFYFVFCKTALTFFIEGEGSAVSTGIEFLKIVSPFYLAVAVKLMLDGLLRGAGSMKAFMVSTFSDLILRVVLAFALSARFGAKGIWMSWPVGWIIAALVSFAFYKKGNWQNNTAE
ncbi:MAG: MATE family efflux transporter [Clostridium sp.]|nr:MATE family efflux transporter [Clostridium sp.]MCM1548057.1 MATE family efflux transporter [Ruminococcus sp.]